LLDVDLLSRWGREEDGEGNKGWERPIKDVAIKYT